MPRRRLDTLTIDRIAAREVIGRPDGGERLPKLAWRNSLERWHAFRDHMERLLVECVNRHLRGAIKARVVEGPTFRITRGRSGRWVVRCVPQFSQNSRVTG
jgi:hypothetical protein